MAFIQLDEDGLQITLAGKTISLLPKEFALFQFLYQNHDQAFSRDSLLDHVWPLEVPVDRTVDDHVYRLRKKLKEWNTYLTIETVRGIGYRLCLTSPSEKSTPSLKDEQFQQQFTRLLTKYHLFGQGEALQTLAGQQQILGAKLDPFYEMYTELLKGNWAVLLKDSIPFWDRAYFMVVLYGILEDDPAIGKNLIEKLLKKNQLPLQRQWELQGMDLVFFQVWCGEFQLASHTLNWAFGKVVEHQIEGFRLAILIQQIFPICMIQSFKNAEIKMKEIEELLKEKPYLREVSYFNLSKGLCHLAIGDINGGKAYIADGMKIMKQAKFELQYLHALTHLTHSIKRLLGKEHSLFIFYKNLRYEMINEYDGNTLKNSFLKQLSFFL
jgi:DNA-binding winged helix-turn-helix (wHTH) protein